MPSETPSPTDTPVATETSTETPTPVATDTPTATATGTPTPSETPTGTLSAVEGWSVVIDYAYDPLYRLTAADYSTGEFFHYSYDAVGNRLSQDTLAGPNTYGYDIANRLIEVDGVAYTWDANGNLLNDGASTYAYNHANRLVSVMQGADDYEFRYNGLGDRVAQNTPGGEINYALDLEARLTQVLADGANAYLYGAGRIGEEQPGGWQYHLGDALGSVRQLLNAGSAVKVARSYEPFGSPLASEGHANSAYSFSGEEVDGTGLTYLRARYYASGFGRFITEDPARIGTNPFTSAGDPIGLTDPSGLVPLPIAGPMAFSLCFDIHTGTHGPTAARILGLPFVPAQLAVDICRTAYSGYAWLPLLSTFDLGEGLPESAHDLFGRFVFETGGRHLVFNGNDKLTRELAASALVQNVRNWYYTPGALTTDPRQRYTGGETPRAVFYPFKPAEYAATLINDSRNSWTVPSLPISNVLGSFWYQTKTTITGRVGFRIDNDMTLESGTHIGGRFRPAYSLSVEGIIQREPLLAFAPVEYIILRYPVISILESATRDETVGPLGGGNVVQTFVWTEARDKACGAYMFERNNPSLLDVDRWEDYFRYTEDPLRELPR
jgi:RHS repeat-associated protein